MIIILHLILKIDRLRSLTSLVLVTSDCFLDDFRSSDAVKVLFLCFHDNWLVEVKVGRI